MQAVYVPYWVFAAETHTFWTADTSQTPAGAPLMTKVDDPNAPYRLYEGDVLINVYWTRAEARREQQKLESEAGSKPRPFTIKDKKGRIVL